MGRGPWEHEHVLGDGEWTSGDGQVCGSEQGIGARGASLVLALCFHMAGGGGGVCKNEVMFSAMDKSSRDRSRSLELKEGLGEGRGVRKGRFLMR